MLFRLLENAFASQKIESRYFKILISDSYHHTPGRGKLLIPPGAAFSQISVSPQQKKGEGVTAIKQFTKYELSHT